MRLYLSFVITLFWFFSQQNTALAFNTNQAFDSQGHRGARGLLPENTLAGFSNALSIGVNTLELDIATTRDGVIVISHDPALNPNITRDKNGNWLSETGPAIRSLTFDELKTYDVGRLKPKTRYQKRFPNQQAINGTHIPTLSQVIQLVRNSANKSTRLNIETKLNPARPELTQSPENFVSTLLKTLEDQNFTNQVSVQSFDWRTLQIIQRLAPEIPTSYLTAQQDWLNNIQPSDDGPSLWTAGFDIRSFQGNIPTMIKAAGGHIWSPYHLDVSSEQIKHAQKLGLKVKVWTVNETHRMEALIDMGVDGIITDYPDRLRQVLEKRGMLGVDNNG